jgi:hypothetical protein
LSPGWSPRGMAPEGRRGPSASSWSIGSPLPEEEAEDVTSG